MDLYSASSWTHLWGTQVWHAFSRDFTVLPAHPAFICYRNEPYLPSPSQPKLVLIYRPRRDERLSWPGRLVTYREKFLAPEIKPADTITHPSTNRARRTVNFALPLRQMQKQRPCLYLNKNVPCCYQRGLNLWTFFSNFKWSQRFFS